MEQITASRTFAHCDEKRGDDQEDHPDTKYGPHGLVGRRYVVGDKQCGQVYQNSAEKIFATSSGLLHDGVVHYWINRIVFH
jgi:hypothetical protein